MLRGYSEGRQISVDLQQVRPSSASWLDERLIGRSNGLLLVVARVMQETDERIHLRAFAQGSKPLQINSTVLSSLLLPFGHLTKPEGTNLAK